MADMFDKEELSIVGGLFPNTLGLANAERQQQQNLAYERFSNAAGARNPFGGLAGLQGMFGTAAGQELQGVMGVQSPATKLAGLREQAAQQFNPNSPEGLAQIAQYLNQNGDSAGARQAVMLAQGQMQKSATLGKTMEETRILGRKEIEVGVPGNTELVQKILVDKDGNVIQKIGDPYSRFNQKTTVDARTIGESEFSKQLGKNDANTVTAAMGTRETAVNTIKSLRQLQTLNDDELVSGTFASGRVGAANFLNTLGLATPSEVARIGNSQEYQKVAKDVVMQTLGGKLGAQISDSDRSYVEGLVAQLETSPLARKNLLKYMVDKNLDVVKESTRLESFARKNRGLDGFDYVIPKESLAPTPKAPAAGGAGYNIKDLQDEAKKRNLPI